VDRAARVPKGQRGAAIAASARAGLLFQPTTPRLVRCNDFKGATKARCFNKARSSDREGDCLDRQTEGC
jgi:hypothetical protein